jgi:hypothetical protein
MTQLTSVSGCSLLSTLILVSITNTSSETAAFQRALVRIWYRQVGYIVY